MDFIEKILNDFEDDFGPSATVQESRPMFNNGGMLVQPSNDGSRPGYAKQKNVGKDLITFKELVKLDLPYSEATLSNVFSSPDRNKNLKKLFKNNGFEVVSKGPRNTLLFNRPSAGQIDNLWQDTIKLAEAGNATIPDKMRIPFKNEVLKVFNEFKKTNAPFTTSDIYYKVVENVGDNKRIFIPKKLKGDTRVPGESIKAALGKDNAKLLLDGNIARIEKTTANRKKMFNLLLKGETDVISLAKDLGISKKDVYAEANKLFDDSYRYNANLVRKTGAGSGYGYLKDYNQSDFNTVLKNLRNSGFEKLDERSARALIYNAYGDKNSVNYSPKKFDASLKKLSEYNKINAELRNTFGKGFQLDHTLSFKALKDLGNTTPENLIRLNPLPENINKMKVAFDRSYNNIITQLRDGNISPNISKNLLEKKKLIEDISTKTNIGSFKVDSSGRKILSFGADPFLKTDIPSQMLKNVDVQNRLVDVLKDYSDEDLKKITKKKSFESLKNLEKIPKKEITAIQQQIKNQFCPGNRSGGTPGSCDISEAMDNMLKKTNAVKQGTIKGAEATRIAQKASKVVRFGTGVGLAKFLGPLGLGAEAVFEVAMAVPGYGKGKSGQRILGDSLLGLIPGVGQSSEEEFAEYATKDGMSQLEQQKIKDVNRFLELNNSLPSAQKNIGKGKRGDPLAGAKTFTKQYKEFSPLYNQFVGGPPSESASTAFAEQQRINDLIKADELERARKRNIAMNEDFMAAGGGIAKMAGDRSGPPPQSGPNSQGLQGLFNRVKNY